MDRTEKREFVASLHEALAATSMIVVTHNTGLSVAEATDLRRRMRTAGVTFKVAKNRLAHLALEGTPFDGLKPLLKGPTALAWSTDPVAAAKATVEFARTNEKLVLIGGALGTQRLDASGVRALAELPNPGSAARADRRDDRHPGHPGCRGPAGFGRAACPGVRRLCQEERGGRSGCRVSLGACSDLRAIVPQDTTRLSPWVKPDGQPLA